MEVVIQEEPFESIARELPALSLLHWDEIANWKETVPLAPDWAKYRALDRAGGLAVLAVRDEGILVGYSIFFITKPIHYSLTPHAMNDVVYLLPQYRSQGIGSRLIDESEAMVRRRGCVIGAWHIKPHYNFGPLLEAKGYALCELAYGKIL